MSRIRNRIALALLASLVPTVCFAWGRDGHRITGYIAENFLKPHARAAVGELLDGKSLADVSTWADEIKRDPSYRWASPLHYTNIEPGADAFDMQRDCPEKGCVVSAIIKYSRVLRDKTASREQRVEALKFLVHFVGDIHQPLHAGLARDRGGNDIKVTFFENRTNLHSLWDSGMIRRPKKGWSEYSTDLAGTVTPQRMTAWTTLDPADWVTESNKLALSHAYAVPKDGQIGQAYFNRNMPVVNEQLAKAGMRLAALLNAIFDDSTELDFIARQDTDQHPRPSP